MANSLHVPVTAALPGQVIRATLNTDFVWAAAIGDPSTTEGMYVAGAGFAADTQKIRVDDATDLYYHFKKFAATVKRDSGTVAIRASQVKYQLHSTQVLTAGREGARFQLVLREISTGNAVVTVEFGSETGNDGFIDIEDHVASSTTRYAQASPLPVTTTIKIEITPFVWRVWLDDTILLYSKSHNPFTVWPLQLSYGYRHISGAPNTPPAGGYIFNEPALSGAWTTAISDFPWDTIDLDGGGWGVDCFDVTDVQVTPSAPVTLLGRGVDSGGNLYFEFLMPPDAPSTIDHVRAYLGFNGMAFGAFAKTSSVAYSADIEMTAGGPGTPLAVDGANPITLQPGATHRVTANYPSSELTFAALGGGTFPATKGQFGTGADVNLFTAPTDAGVYTFSVTRGAEVVTVTVKVPCVLTPVAVSMVGATTQAFTTNFNVVDFATTGWLVTGGSLSSKAVRSVTYTAPGSAGAFEISAQANVTGILVGVIVAPVTVTSSGPAPSTGLRLTPGAGYSAQVNNVVPVTLEGDVSPAIWQMISGFRIDGATNNLFLLNNRAFSLARIAQAILSSTANLKWAFNSTNLCTVADRAYYTWAVTDVGDGILAYITFQYLQNGNDWRVSVIEQGTVVATADFTATATSEMQIDFTSSTVAVFKYRASSAAGWTTLTTLTLAGARYFQFWTNPFITTRADNTVICAAPVLSGAFGRWYPPNWAAEMLDALDNVIGALPVQAVESVNVVGGFKNQQAFVTLTTPGRGRVRATYPSGVVAQNTVPLTITGAGAALAVTSPASPVTMDPGATQTVTTNYTVDEVSFFAPTGGGSFGTTILTKNIYTAPAKSGFYYFEARKGAETVRIDVRVRPKISQGGVVVSAISIQAEQTTSLLVNDDTIQQTVSATSGTASFGAKVGGTTVISYTAPATPGTYTINYSNLIGNVSVTVTVTAVGTTPVVISNSDPQTLNPGVTLQILTNYPAAEVVFTVAIFGTAVNLLGYFTGDVFRAPAQAGKYVITAAKPGATSDTLIVIVPIKITPKTPGPVQPPNKIQFTANYSPVAWLVPPARQSSIDSNGLFTPGTTPDTIVVTVAGVIDGVLYQDTAIVTVLSPTLSLQNPATMTVQPGATVTVLLSSPYVLADVSLAATAGSFASNVWTAPADAGIYTITVTHTLSGQTATIVVTVPVVITPASWGMLVTDTKVFTTNADVTSFSATTGLTLTAPGLRTVTASAAVSGTYILTANTALGNVTATITVTGTATAPLTIANTDPTIVESGQQLIINTNYPSAEVTFSVPPGGGTFVGNVYTAPLIAGSYVITATRGALTDTMTVNVPVRISPAAVVLQPGQTQQFTVNHPSFTWSQGAPGGGFLLATGHYTAGSNPGSYPNSIRVSTPAGTAFASVTIQQVDLVVYGPRSIILEPLGTYRVESNPSGRSVQYTASGGSFGVASEGSLYTAPSLAGDYFFTVTYAGQTIRIDVHVPLRISPKSINLAAGGTFQFTVNATGASWAVSSTSGATGTIGATGFYTAPLSGGTIVLVTASGNGDSDTAQVFFLDVYPYNPTRAVEGETSARVALAFTEDGSPRGRLKSAIKKTYQVHYDAREKAEFVAALAWHAAHFPEGPFLFHDHDLDDFVAVYFDSQVKWQVNGACAFDYSWRLKEV